MAQAAVLFVSNRAQKLTAAMLCLMAAHLVLASCTPEPTTNFGFARVAISGR